MSASSSRPAAFIKQTLPLAVAAALSTTALAEQTQTQADLVIYADTYRNTGSKSALAPEETPQGITVISREQLDLRGANSINQALRYTPGVNTEIRGGSVVRQDQFNIRGFENDQNYYDGLPLLYNNWNLQPQIEAAAVEQIEIFKGPTSVLYGAMPPGGMVNIIAKQPSATPSADIEIATGSHKLRQATVNATGTVAGREDLSYTFTGLARAKDSQAVTADEERYMLTGSVDWQLSAQTLVNFNLYHQQDPSAGIYNTVPAAGSVFANPNGKLPVSSYAGDANWNEYDRDVTLLGYKINHQFNSEWTLLHNARFMDASALQKNTYNTGLAADNRTLGRRAYLTDEDSRSFTLDNQLAGRVQWGETEHNLLFGIDYLKLRSDVRYEDDATASIDLFAPNHYQIDPNLSLSNTVYSSDFSIDRSQLGFYFQDQVRLGNWVLIGGVRHDRYRDTEQGRKYNAPVNTKVSQSNNSARVGALYNFDNGLAPFISYAESFQPQGGSDRNGNVFKPTEGKQWEAGVKYVPLDSDSQFTLSAFRITKQNELTRDPNGGPYDKVQAGEIRSQGVEFEANHAFTDQFSLDFSASVLSMKYTKDNQGLQGKTPVWVPERKASLWANYQLAGGSFDGTTLGAGVRYLGETQLDANNTDQVPSYTLVDLAVNVDLAPFSSKLKGSSVNFSVNNLFDKRNVSCYDANNCWFGAERSVELSFKHAF